MSDIVERLRQKERDYYQRDTGGAYGMGPVLRDAADEIERLRRELLLISQLQAGDGSTINGLTKDQLGRAFRQAQNIARAALGIVTHGDCSAPMVNHEAKPVCRKCGKPLDTRGRCRIPGHNDSAADQPEAAPVEYECVGYQYKFPSRFTNGSTWRDSPADYNGIRSTGSRKIFAEILVAGQPERCCLDYPRCDCNSPPEPDDDWLCFQRPAQPKVTP